MNQSRWISSDQIGINSVILVISSALLYLPSVTVLLAGRDAWLSVAVAGVGYVVLAWLITVLYFLPGQTPMQLAASIGSAPLRAIAGLVLCVYSGIVTILVVRETAALFSTIMQETPGTVFVVGVAGTGAILAWMGRETILRTGQIFFPALLLISLVNVGLVLPANTDLGQLLPVLEHGLLPVFKALPPLLAWGSELVILTVFAGTVINPERLRLFLPAGAVIITGLILVFTIGIIVVFGPGEAARINVPGLSLARQVRLTAYFTRMEVLLMIAWLVGTLIKIGITIYAACSALEGGFKLSGRWRPHIVALITLITAIIANYIVPNQLALIQLLGSTWPVIGTTGAVVIILFGLLGRWLHRPRMTKS